MEPKPGGRQSTAWLYSSRCTIGLAWAGAFETPVVVLVGLTVVCGSVSTYESYDHGVVRRQGGVHAQVSAKQLIWKRGQRRVTVP